MSKSSKVHRSQATAIRKGISDFYKGVSHPGWTPTLMTHRVTALWVLGWTTAYWRAWNRVPPAELQHWRALERFRDRMRRATGNTPPAQL